VQANQDFITSRYVRKRPVGGDFSSILLKQDNMVSEGAVVGRRGDQNNRYCCCGNPQPPSLKALHVELFHEQCRKDAQKRDIGNEIAQLLQAIGPDNGVIKGRKTEQQQRPPPVGPETEHHAEAGSNS